MKKFRFTLGTVRHVRQAEEQAAQKAVAEAVCACEETSIRLALLDRDLQNAWQAMRNGMVQGLRADQMCHARSWSLVLEEKHQQLTRDLEAAKDKLRVTRQVLHEATRRRETLDRLLSKKRGEHHHAAQREDQKFLDEIATRRSWRGAAQLEAA